MSKKIGRNDKCFCGSSKKYKKCCMGGVKVRYVDMFDALPILEKLIDNKDTLTEVKKESFYGSNIKNKEILNTEYIDRVRKIENLPNEVKWDVQRLTQTQPFKRLGCYYNAVQTALSIKGVKKVDGWYGFDFTAETDRKIGYDEKKKKPYFKGLTKVLNLKKKFTKISDGVFALTASKWENDNGRIFDFKNRITYGRHCWNSYKGIHFDMTKTLDKNLKDNWIYYLVIDDDVNIHTDGLKGDLTQSYCDKVLLFADEYAVLNEDLVGRSMPTTPLNIVKQLANA